MTLVPTSSQAVAPTGAAGGDLTGTYPNPTIGAGKVTLAKLAAALPYVLVQTGVPVAFSSPFVYDNTAVTGGLYGWDGAAYQKIGPL